MREVVVRVPADALEEILDRLLPLLPGGVRETEAGPGWLELSMRGADLPPASAIAAAVGPRGQDLQSREMPDDWRERRRADYQARPVAERLVVRPPWAPAPPPGLIDLVIEEGHGFGEGTHPTTRGCLELLLDLTPAGGFADLGCGSGVLAILAGLLGWAPVLALDGDPDSVAATRTNAARNRVTLQAELADLLAPPVLRAAGFAANIPAAVHLGLTAAWSGQRPDVGLLSGFGPGDTDAVLAGYARLGLHEQHREEHPGWCVILVGSG